MASIPPQQTTVTHGEDEFAITLTDQDTEHDTPYMLTYLNGPRKGRKFKLHQDPEDPEIVFSGFGSDVTGPDYLFEVGEDGHIQEITLPGDSELPTSAGTAVGSRKGRKAPFSPKPLLSIAENQPCDVTDPSGIPASQADLLVLRAFITKLERDVVEIYRSSAYQELRVSKTAQSLRDEVAHHAIQEARINVTTAAEVARRELTIILADNADANHTDLRNRISQIEATLNHAQLQLSRITQLELALSRSRFQFWCAFALLALCLLSMFLLTLRQ